MVVHKPLVSYDASEAGTNGVIVTLDLLKIFPAQKPQNFIYIVDKSGSMSEDIGYVKDILGVWLQTAPIGCGVLIVTFSDNVDVLFHTHYLDESNRADGLVAVKSLLAWGHTNIELGISTALSMQVKLNTSLSSRVVLLTDGHANLGERDPTRLASFMARFESQVDVIMLTKNSSPSLTEAIQKLDTQNSGYFAESGDQLKSVFNQIFETFSRELLLAEVDNITKEVHPHYLGNTIDLLFDEVDPSCNPSINIFVVYSGVKEQLVGTTFSETRGYKEISVLKGMIAGILALKKLGAVKSDIITNKTNADVKTASDTMEEVQKKLCELHFMAESATYRSLSAEVAELSPIVKAIARKDPGECPVKFETKEIKTEQPEGCCYRSLCSSSSFVKEFACPEDEEAYAQWENEKAIFNGEVLPVHALLALKPVSV